MKLKKFILSPAFDEAAYPGNIGFMEMAKFYQDATPSQVKKMEKIIKDEDWEGFKRMIRKVLDVSLH